MYDQPNNYPAETMPGSALGQIQTRRLDITLRQNIDERIKQAEAHVAELEATKVRMEKSGILDMRIDDIQRAMRF
jgi:hypothetical protein